MPRKASSASGRPPVSEIAEPGNWVIRAARLRRHHDDLRLLIAGRAARVVTAEPRLGAVPQIQRLHELVRVRACPRVHDRMPVPLPERRFSRGGVEVELDHLPVALVLVVPVVAPSPPAPVGTAPPFQRMTRAASARPPVRTSQRAAAPHRRHRGDAAGTSNITRPATASTERKPIPRCYEATRPALTARPLVSARSVSAHGWRAGRCSTHARIRVVSGESESPAFAGLSVEADEGTRTLDLLHGKSTQTFAPVRSRSLKRPICRAFSKSTEHERTRANAECDHCDHESTSSGP